MNLPDSVTLRLWARCCAGKEYYDDVVSCDGFEHVFEETTFEELKPREFMREFNIKRN